MEVSLYAILADDVSGEKHYVVLEYEKDFLDVQMKIFTLAGLKSEITRLEAELAVTGCVNCDFDVVDGVFRCNPMIKEVSLSQKTIQEYTDGLRKDPNLSDNTLYALLIRGVKEGYLLVDDSVNGESCGADRVTKFHNIRFSQGTMSVYAPMYSQEGFYNKMLVIPREALLVFQPFKFATPITVPQIPYCERQGTITVNGEEYVLWQTGTLGIYDDSVVLAGCLINYCMSGRNAYVDAIGVLGDYYRKVSGVDRDGAVWIGGDKNYKSRYGVYLTSSGGRMSSADRADLVQSVLEGVKCGLSEEEIAMALSQELPKLGYSNGAVYAAKLLLHVIQHSGREELLVNLMHIQQQCKDALFWHDLYLYRVRTKAYLKKVSLAPAMLPMLTGGRTRDVTYVKAVYTL